LSKELENVSYLIMTKISSSDVRKVAKLARLELPEDQIETYTAQLEEILSYVEQLQEIDTKNIPPTTRAVEVVNSMREDIVEVKHSREEIINQAPHREGDFFRVPKIM
tara:strand:- start:208 stop:531 length:324 start_codon:yes stop_codon:yes gene_type:complete